MRPTVLVISLLLVFGYPASLMGASAPPAQPGESYPVPTGAAPGSTAERTSAWEGLSSTQQGQYINNFWNTIVPQATLRALAERDDDREMAAPAPNPLLGASVGRLAPAEASRQPPELVAVGKIPSVPLIPAPCPFFEEPCECPEATSGKAAPGEPLDAVHIVASPTSGTAPLTVGFSVSWSQPIQTYFWSFGDGGTSMAASPSHTYSTAGTYTVQVTVTRATTCDLYSDTQTISVSAPPQSGPDLDNDDLEDQFEDDLAYAFRPIYHVSYGELSGTGFANFGDYVPQTATQLFPAVPPRNHVRVKPIGMIWLNGQYLGFLQIDYFTMWNRDDGLVVSNWCIYLTGGVAWFLEPWVAFSHALDNERSAVLVAAPVVGGDYNPSPGAYKAYDYYTAAHEDTLNDKSRYIAPTSPVPAYTSVLLGLSLSKHATYTFNPDGLPLAPSWVMYAVYGELDWLYFTGQIDWWEYLIYLYIADVVFYACWIEHFIEQGGWLPGASKNVGDVGNAINASGFIETSALRTKLNKTLWYIQ